MSLFGVALAAAVATAEPCTTVRREQAAISAGIFARLERINRGARRPDGSKRPPTASERKEFAAIEAEVEAFIDLFNARLSSCQEN